MPSISQLTHKYHLHPRMSANQLSEYLTANAPNRHRILQDAKFPSTMIVIRYEEARRAVVSFMAGSQTAIEHSIVALYRRGQDPSQTAYSKKNRDLCIEALESFKANFGKVIPEDISFRKPDLHNTKLKLKDVSVSVAVDLMTERKGRDGTRSIGAAVLVITKSKKAGAEIEARCKSTALLIYQLLRAQANTAQICDPTLCMAIDVFNGKMYSAPKHHKKILNTLEISCGEIGILWPSIPPPKGYNGPTISVVA